ncbi:hypothetical protein JYT29_03100 [Nitrospina gracilis]|nr:hypothetical protein [Nitrospinaceae bacterium]MBN4078296.1 hypothetical protein [Nitrospina gracilis]
MQGISGAGAAQGVSPQYQATALKTAQNTQKQENQAATSHTQGAAQASGQTGSPHSDNAIDVTA